MNKDQIAINTQEIINMTLSMGMGNFIGKRVATIMEDTLGIIDMVMERCFGQMEAIIEEIGKWG